MPAASETIAVNTGPLIALGACHQLELLRRMHPRVLVPRAVMDEFLHGGSDRAAVASPPWLEVVAIAASPVVTQHLDEGEDAVIALALEHRIGTVVIDERRGRMLARSLGLRVTGSIGVLLRAKRLGLLPAVAPCLEAMQRAGVWISRRLPSRRCAKPGKPKQAERREHVRDRR
jgi:hypothetical protein